MLSLSKGLQEVKSKCFWNRKSSRVDSSTEHDAKASGNTVGSIFQGATGASESSRPFTTRIRSLFSSKHHRPTIKTTSPGSSPTPQASDTATTRAVVEESGASSDAKRISSVQKSRSIRIDIVPPYALDDGTNDNVNDTFFTTSRQVQQEQKGGASSPPDPSAVTASLPEIADNPSIKSDIATSGLPTKPALPHCPMTYKVAKKVGRMRIPELQSPAKAPPTTTHIHRNQGPTCTKEQYTTPSQEDAATATQAHQTGTSKRTARGVPTATRR